MATFAKAWVGFNLGDWCEKIDVRDFIQKNYTPYEGDASFLANVTEKTQKLWVWKTIDHRNHNLIWWTS